jgi:hypothetical protein
VSRVTTARERGFVQGPFVISASAYEWIMRTKDVRERGSHESTKAMCCLLPVSRVTTARERGFVQGPLVISASAYECIMRTKDVRERGSHEPTKALCCFEAVAVSWL